MYSQIPNSCKIKEDCREELSDDKSLEFYDQYELVPYLFTLFSDFISVYFKIFLSSMNFSLHWTISFRYGNLNQGVNEREKELQFES